MDALSLRGHVRLNILTVSKIVTIMFLELRVWLLDPMYRNLDLVEILGIQRNESGHSMYVTPWEPISRVEDSEIHKAYQRGAEGQVCLLRYTLFFHHETVRQKLRRLGLWHFYLGDFHPYLE